MKSYIVTLLLLFCSFMTCVYAQDSKVFRFVYENSPATSKMVLYHNTNTNAAELKIKSSQDFTNTKGYLDAFILHKVANQKGRVLIASAKAPEFFLKVNSNTNEVTMNKITEGANVNSFTWEVILNKETDTNIVALQTILKNRFALKKDNQRLIIADRKKQGGTDEDQSFSFRLEQIVNVF
ncbi:hypothetical protein [Tenacibaculum sp. nBUS_03]|uniref:hypothetical protein n=1 Tax=Tenacibaculum sp. nBUS_03 TaxID=3395320 RepID=UPI003EBD65AE